MSKKTTKTAVKTTKAAPKAAPKKEGLRKPQIRILAALKKATKPLTRAEIAVKAPVDVAMCVEYIGSADPEVRKANDAKHWKSLITLGFVRLMNDEERGWIHEITASGKAALEKALKA